jgi:hypothetical protein
MNLRPGVATKVAMAVGWVQRVKRVKLAWMASHDLLARLASQANWAQRRQLANQAQQVNRAQRVKRTQRVQRIQACDCT